MERSGSVVSLFIRRLDARRARYSAWACRAVPGGNDDLRTIGGDQLISLDRTGSTLNDSASGDLRAFPYRT